MHIKFSEKPEGNISFGKSKRRYEENNKTYL